MSDYTGERMNWRDARLYELAFAEGMRCARSRCDICPARAESGQPVLISGEDVLYRRGIEN